MKTFLKNIYLTVALYATFLATSISTFVNRVHCFFSRVYLATVIEVASLVASVLESLVAHVIQLKGLDLNSPPAPPPVEPTIDDVWGSHSYHAPRKQFMSPYMPSWVRASLKDPTKHPGYATRRPQPEVVISVEEPLQATMPSVSEASAGIEGHCAPPQLVNNESSETISGTVSSTILDIH